MKNDGLKAINEAVEAQASSHAFEKIDTSSPDAELRVLRSIVVDLADYIQRLPGHDITREELILRVRLLK